MNCQYICHYNSDKVERLKRLKQVLERETNYRENQNRLKQIRVKQFNFGSNDKCKYGLSCNKVSLANNAFNRLKREVEELMTLYIELKNYERYYSILELLRGHFPTAYNQFQTEIIKNKDN